MLTDYMAYKIIGGTVFNPIVSFLAVGLGGSSKFEINTEKRNFEGLNKTSKIEDLPTVKISFYDLSAELINYLKNSTTADSLLFVNRDGLYNGFYQSHYQYDEFKKEVVLTLYFVREIGSDPLPQMTNLEVGLPMVNPFGRGNFKINSVELPIDISFLEKNTNTNVEKYKFSNGYKYYFDDEISFKILVNGAVKGGLVDSSITALKNTMVTFQPHLDCAKIYNNLFLDYEIKIEEQKSRIEIELKSVK